MKTRLIQLIVRGLTVALGAAAVKLGGNASDLGGSIETVAAAAAAILLFFADLVIHQLRSRSTIAASILKLLNGDKPAALPADLTDDELAIVRKFAESLHAQK